MARLVTFYVPEDGALLTAIARVAVCHGHLEYSLRMMIKSFRGISIPDAFKATQWWSASRLRREIVAAARKLFGTGTEVERIEEVLGRAAKLSEARNKIIHGTYAKELDGSPRFRDEQLRWQAFPRAPDVSALADDITALTREMNETRLQGWLGAAIRRAVETRGTG